MKKRVLLNVICSLLIVLSVVGIVLVLNSARHVEVIEDNKAYVEQNDFQNREENMAPNMNENNGERPTPPSGERPELPNGEMPQEFNGNFEGQEPPEKPTGDMNQVNPNEEVIQKKYVELTSVQIGIVILCSVVISVSLLLMLWTKFFGVSFKDTFINADKYLLFIFETILFAGIVSGLVIFFSSKLSIVVDEENKEINYEAKVVNQKEIKLSNYDTNIKITEGGEYTIEGSFKYSVFIDSSKDVVINLNNVNIESSETAAIANIGTNKITINLLENTKNSLSDGGASDYDGCLYSNGPLVIQGDGELDVKGLQQEGEGIATTDNDIIINGGIIKVESADDGLNAGGDNGGSLVINDGVLYIKASGDGIDSNGNIEINGGIVYAMGSSLGGDAGLDADKGIAINGGTVIALGSDMLEPPTSSKQKYLAITLNEKIESKSLVTLLDEKENVVASFQADETFKTLVFSDIDLKTGEYKIYVGGTNTGKLYNSIYDNGDYTKGELLQTVSVN